MVSKLLKFAHLGVASLNARLRISLITYLDSL